MKAYSNVIQSTENILNQDNLAVTSLNLQSQAAKAIVVAAQVNPYVVQHPS